MRKSSTTSGSETIESIAIGSFDGLHRAHQQLLAQLDEKGALLIVDKGFSPALTPDRERCHYTDYPCFFLKFETIRHMDAEAFMKYLRELFPLLKKIVVGYDFRFGKNRTGDPRMLRRLDGIETVVVEEQSLDGISIHAKEIRLFLQQGKIASANRLLGRAYVVRGEVIRGQGLGKKALYPTLNMDTGDFLLPAEGVYITQTQIGDSRYPSLTFIGKRLSTDSVFSVETHLLATSLNMDVTEATLYFLEYLRPNRKFTSLDALKRQIGEDIEKAEAFFRAGHNF